MSNTDLETIFTIICNSIVKNNLNSIWTATKDEDKETVTISKFFPLSEVILSSNNTELQEDEVEILKKGKYVESAFDQCHNDKSNNIELKKVKYTSENLDMTHNSWVPYLTEEGKYVYSQLTLMPGKKVTCPMCKINFLTVQKTFFHYTRVHQKMLFICNECPKKFFKIDLLRVHFDKYHKSFSGKCVKCKKVFDKRKEYEQHFMVCYNKEYLESIIVDDLLRVRPETSQFENHLHYGSVDLYSHAQSNYQEVLPNDLDPDYENESELLLTKSYDSNTLKESHSYNQQYIEKKKKCKKNKWFIGNWWIPYLTEEGVKIFTQMEQVSGFITCSLCQQTFVKALTAFKHYIEFHKKMVVACNECPRKFFSWERLKVHLDKYHNCSKGTFLCALCRKVFQTQTVLNEHRKYEHSQKHSRVMLQCHFCDDIFEFKRERQIHVFKEHKNVVKYCPICGKSLVNEKRLGCHMRVVHPKESENYALSCEFCSKKIYCPESLSYHYDLHHKDKLVDGQIHTCPEPKCKKTFSSLKGCDRHFNQHHSKKKTKKKIVKYPCPICGKLLTNLTRHVKDKHDNDNHHKVPEKFPCSLCPHVYSSKAGLRSHVNVSHKKLVKTCPNCPKTFTNTGTLKQHIVDKHERKNDYICNICHKSYKAKSELTVHVNGVHHSIKYKCDLCDSHFNRGADRNRHEREIHKYTRPIKRRLNEDSSCVSTINTIAI